MKAKAIDFQKFAENAYYRYGVAVNEERSVPSSVDGLKPVIRKSLWAGFKMGLTSGSHLYKSARVVGDVIGLYSPHGDAATYDAIVRNVNAPVPLFYGEGNFGTFTEGAAAFRYTNIKFTKFCDEYMFDKFYLPAVDMVSNYDGSTTEPVLLPAKLPYLLLHGTAGIGVGIATSVPAFTLESVLKVVQSALRDYQKAKDTESYVIPYKILRGLEIHNSTGGKVDHVAQKDEIKKVLTEGKGRIIYHSGWKKKTASTIVFDELAVYSFVGPIRKLLKDKDVSSVRDVSDKNDKFKGSLEVTFKRTVKGERLEAAIKRAETAMQNAVTFDCKTTDRKFNEKKDDVDVTLKNTSVAGILKDWIEFRIDLEKRACAHWAGVVDKKINRENLLILAIKNMDYLTKRLKSAKTRQVLISDIAKTLKISKEDAEIVVQFRLIQLSRTEVNTVKERIKALKEEKAGYQQRIKEPLTYVIESLKKAKIKR